MTPRTTKELPSQPFAATGVMMVRDFLAKLVTPCHLERELRREACRKNPRLEDRNEP